MSTTGTAPAPAGPDEPSCPAGWRPPTPESVLTKASEPAVGPPPLTLPPPATVPSITTTSFAPSQPGKLSSLAGLLNRDEPGVGRATPGCSLSSTSTNSDAGGSGAVAPVRGYFNGGGGLASGSLKPALELDETSMSPILQAALEADDVAHRKRPRREASVAAKKALRQPSPLDLESPPPPKATGPSTQSNRKVSHSLIERRRREKINDCLAHLKQLVPQCREEGERKEARAKERGRKRGRKNDDDDDGQRGGLHKLEVLQGTIQYIEELEARLASLENGLVHKFRQEATPSQDSSDASTAPSPAQLETIRPVVEAPPRVTAGPSNVNWVANDAPKGLVGFSHHPPTRLDPPPHSRAFQPNELDRDTAAGLLLLKFSTSPELRPVLFDD